MKMTEEQKNLTLGQVEEAKKALEENIRSLMKDFTNRTGMFIEVNADTEMYNNYTPESNDCGEEKLACRVCSRIIRMFND